MKKNNVIISCPTKFHAFNLAEQLDRLNHLHTFYTTYASQKNKLASKFVRRKDKEKINSKKINTNIKLAIAKKLNITNDFLWLEKCDKWVAKQIKNKTNYDFFIGWAGISLHSIRAAKQKDKITIVERGSSHINFQNKILKEEYKKFGTSYNIDQRVIDKNIQEYELTDYISIPSNYVKKTFLEEGIPESKLIINPYGTSNYFTPTPKKDKKFRILYMGSMTIRKGLIYLFEAIKSLEISLDNYEVWFLGKINPEIESTIEKYKARNWIFHGFINHYELSTYISQCDVFVHPSLEEGLSMVIPQVLSCGVPVIASMNTGGEMVIKNKKNGYIIPIRDSNSITEILYTLYNHPNQLSILKENTLLFSQNICWENYGESYYESLSTIIDK